MTFESNNKKVKKWIVKVVIRELQELKDATGNEIVYCKVKIGNEQFETKEKPMTDLKFDQEFKAIIPVDQHQKAFSYKIVIEARKFVKT